MNSSLLQELRDALEDNLIYLGGNWTPEAIREIREKNYELICRVDAAKREEQ